MPLEKKIKSTFSHPEKITLLRYTSAKICFIFFCGLFFLNYFFVGARFYYEFNLFLLPFTYTLFVFSLFLYVFYTSVEKLQGKVHKIFLYILFLVLFCYFVFIFIFFCSWFMRHTIFLFIKIILLFLTVFSLASCGDDEEAKIDLETKVLEDFSISLPGSWPLVSQESEWVPKPSSWEVVLIASATEAQNGFANNMVILKRAISQKTSIKRIFTCQQNMNEKTILLLCRYSFRRYNFLWWRSFLSIYIFSSI